MSRGSLLPVLTRTFSFAVFSLFSVTSHGDSSYSPVPILHARKMHIQTTKKGNASTNVFTPKAPMYESVLHSIETSLRPLVSLMYLTQSGQWHADGVRNHLAPSALILWLINLMKTDHLHSHLSLPYELFSVIYF